MLLPALLAFVPAARDLYLEPPPHKADARVVELEITAEAAFTEE